MPVVHHPCSARDAEMVAGLRQAMSAQKGRFAGVGARAPFEAQKNAVAAAPGVRMEAGVLGGVPGWWCRPVDPRPDAALIYYHGGWYMLGTAESFRNQASHFTAGTRAPAFIPDYRRAPEHPFPAAFDDAVSVHRALAASGVARLALVGDSVGGSLALLTAAAALDQPVTQPSGAVVMSPVTDLTLSGASMETRAAADPIFTKEVAAQFAAAYLAGADPRDPRASPLHGPVAGLPPIRIDVGEDEILLDDSLRYAERAEAAGVSVTAGVWSGMPHTFQSLIGRAEAAAEAVQAEIEFLNGLFDRSP